jgi:hypothetical protein
VFSQTSTIERGLPALAGVNYKLKGTDHGDKANERRMKNNEEYKSYNIWT